MWKILLLIPLLSGCVVTEVFDTLNQCQQDNVHLKSIITNTI